MRLRAAAETLACENEAKAAPITERLEAAIARKDRFEAEGLLAEAEKLIPKSPKMPSLRERAADVPGPKPQLTLDLGGGMTMELVLIRPGSFDMGSEKGDAEAGLGEYAWFSGNAGQMTRVVGQKKPNKWGIFDMHGNVWEWCEDVWHDSYEGGAPADGSAWTQGGNQGLRVLRGGSWFCGPPVSRSAARGRGDPSTGLVYFVGTRGPMKAPDSFSPARAALAAMLRAASPLVQRATPRKVVHRKKHLGVGGGVRMSRLGVALFEHWVRTVGAALVAAPTSPSSSGVRRATPKLLSKIRHLSSLPAFASCNRSDGARMAHRPPPLRFAERGKEGVQG